jgi:hypothetical protein
MNIPEEEREHDKEPMTKEEVHEHNREEQQKAHAHENQNPNLAKGRNPIHHDQGGR